MIPDVFNHGLYTKCLIMTYPWIWVQQQGLITSDDSQCGWENMNSYWLDALIRQFFGDVIVMRFNVYDTGSVMIVINKQYCIIIINYQPLTLHTIFNHKPVHDGQFEWCAKFDNSGTATAEVLPPQDIDRAVRVMTHADMSFRHRFASSTSRY